MTFTSGDFNKLGKVYRISESAVPDTSGHIDESNDANWRLIGPRHFNIVPKGSREFLVGDQVNAQTTHQLATTFDKQSKAFSTKDKFIYQGRTFSFSGPGQNVLERNRWLAFPAIELPTETI